MHSIHSQALGCDFHLGFRCSPSSVFPKQFNRSIPLVGHFTVHLGSVATYTFLVWLSLIFHSILAESLTNISFATNFGSTLARFVIICNQVFLFKMLSLYLFIIHLAFAHSFIICSFSSHMCSFRLIILCHLKLG